MNYFGNVPRLLAPLGCVIGLLASQDCPAATYEEWKAIQFTEEEQWDPDISGELADPDADGLTNFLEYALASAPKVADGTSLPVVEMGADQHLIMQYTELKLTTGLLPCRMVMT